MKKLSILFLSLWTLVSFAQQAPKFSIQPNSKAQGLTTPGFCQIEVANHSSRGAVVDIYYDDAPGFRNNYVQPGYSLFVDLNYAGYCHNRSYLVVSTPESYLLYAKYTGVYSTVDIYNAYNNKLEAKLLDKASA